MQKKKKSMKPRGLVAFKLARLEFPNWRFWDFNGLRYFPGLLKPKQRLCKISGFKRAEYDFSGGATVVRDCKERYKTSQRSFPRSHCDTDQPTKAGSEGSCKFSKRTKKKKTLCTSEIDHFRLRCRLVRQIAYE